MASHRPPGITDFLAKLASDWRLCKSKFERQCGPLSQQAERESVKQLRRKLDMQAEALDSAYHAHPFPGVLRFACRDSGLDRDELRKAALSEFNGEMVIVNALKGLERDRFVEAMLRKMAKECPKVLHRLFPGVKLTPTDDAQVEPKEPCGQQGTDAHATPKRRGRKKAGYERVQREAALAAKWVQARGAGVPKIDFARESGTTIPELDLLLDRVAKRKKHYE